MIIAYFDFILIYFIIKRQRKQYILQRKAMKENLNEEYVIKKIYIISLERRMKIVTTKGLEKFLKKHKNVKSVRKTNYIGNKWLDVADGVDIPQDWV